MSRVFITDTKYRMTLSPLWELSRAGYEITCVDYADVCERERLGCFSKFATGREIIEDNSFLTRMSEICGEDRPVLLPGNRRSLMHMIRHREQLSAYCDFLIPDEQSLALADDKEAMYRIACEISVPVPSTTSLSEHNSVAEMADSVRYPCIIKYRNGERLGKKPAERYSIVHDREAFIAAYSKMHETDANPIASDYLTGHDIGVAVVMSKTGEPISYLCYESLREYPIQGGPTCFLRTIHAPKIVDYSVRLLQKIGFCGIAMLDFKGTPNDAYFLEINPRLWGSAAITYLSGCPFFHAYVQGARGETQAAVTDYNKPPYKLGVKMRFTPQALACFVSHMKNSPDKAKILMEYAKSFFDFTVHDGLFTVRDPIPYVKYIQNLIKRS